MELRKEILDTLEQDARISPKELAIRLGAVRLMLIMK